MKMVKSLILGSAAGLIAVGGAQAADLPVKAAAVEYVRICSLYGAGFYYMPGTDTCIKIGGYLRADTIGNSGNDYGFSTGAPDGAKNRLRNNFTSRARQDLTIDTRTATEYGVVRTFAELVFTWTGGEYVGNGALHQHDRGDDALQQHDRHHWRRPARSVQRVHPVRWVHVRSRVFVLRRAVAELSGWRP